MAQTKAKKQPKRGSRKPAQKRKPKAPRELMPHKIVGQLVGKRLNEHGEIVAEEPMGDVAIFSANFSKVPQLVKDAVEQTREIERIRRETMSDG
jgi:hypothetical protein